VVEIDPFEFYDRTPADVPSKDEIIYLLLLGVMIMIICIIAILAYGG